MAGIVTAIMEILANYRIVLIRPVNGVRYEWWIERRG